MEIDFQSQWCQQANGAWKYAEMVLSNGLIPSTAGRMR